MFFKLNPGTDDRARRHVLRLARASGATRVRRLFPRVTDTNLRSHFVAEVAGESEARALVAALKRSPDVAFAHRETRRRRLDDPD